ncbi:vascular endothelial growth factor receptor 1 isoform X2 [Toxorhynchites rutilus septentrionalis]|uniref:vascular endothelial growth factor receptor 1 isoform X2 n=1 Tax=Toxorhynchites rutilus septentrionalis TaxID=329112 RepID=UPI0024791322|nr:vascular endothelial growth factor receptor 1 isoform X2 [Toxorhynchites rutilus septentrionalis]
MTKFRVKMHNQCATRAKMRQSTVIYLIIFVQIVVWSRWGNALPSDLEANEMYRDLLAENGAPEIVGYKPEVELEAGSHYELFCKSAEPIRWHVSRSENEEIESPEFISIEDIETNDANKPHGSRVTIANATAVVVGRYYCVYVAEADKPDQNLDELEALYKATSAYIFVKDPQTPLVPIQHPIVTANQYEEVVIPCKPSSKDVHVELVKDEQEMQIDNYKYSETIGFVLTLVRLDESGVYLCRSKETSTQQLHFHVDVMESSVTDRISNPRVESKTGENIKQGDSIQLVCRLDVSEGIKFNIRWLLPSKHIARNDSRVTVSSITVIPHPERPHYIVGTSELTVKDAQASDTGMYRCEAEDHNKYTSYRFTRVNVVAPEAAFIKIYEENNLKVINTTTRRPITIVLRYDAHPKPLFHWIRDDSDKALAPGDKYDMLEDDRQVKLSIKRPNVYDSGLYILHAENEGVQTTYEMKVFVREKPVLSINPVFARPKETVTFVCTCIGYPKPNMRFAFIPCTSEPWTNCSGPIQPKQVQEYNYATSARLVAWAEPDEIIMVRGFRLHGTGRNQEVITVEQYSFQAETAGYVGCIAENSEGRDFAKADLLISDLDEPVMIAQESPKGEVTYGDRVEIVCAASVYNYTKQITFFKDNEELIEDADKGISFQDWYETYAYRRRLVIETASEENEGEIRCQANVVSTDQVESKEIRLVVHEPVLPRILEGTATVDLQLGMGETNQFQCSVDGMPKPTVEWLKDDAPMDFENETRLLLINETTVFFQFLREEDSGEYSCRARNKVGQTEKMWSLRVKTVAIRRTWIYLVLSLLIILIIAVIMISLFYYKKKKEVKAMKEAGLANFEEGNLDQMNPEISLDEQADLLPYKSEYEFPKEKLKLGKQLGAGAFGVVMKATASGIMVNEDETTVAVKMVKKQTDNEVMRALISELKIMVHLGQHLNVVNLLGAVTKNIAKRELMVIVEYCRFGNVQNFLLKHRPYFIDQINSDTGEIDSTIDKNQLRWSKAGYMYNSQGLKYVNLSFSTHNVNKHNNHNNNNNHHQINNNPIYCNYINSSNSSDYPNPKNHINSKGYVRHSGIQNMAMVDSCNTEATVMTSIEGEELNTANTVNSNEPLWRSNIGTDYKGPARSVTTTDLVCWASQVACGMEYLASRKVLHGDLAARNILLCDDNVVKICDFGLARSMYKSDNYKKKGEAPLPFKWLALECISDNIFGTYSDVWAYGIVLWEFFSLAKIPYPGMEANQELYNKLRDGYRMDKPQYANQDVYDIMLNCWNVKPDSRPSFKDLKSRFNAMLPEELKNHYIDLNEPYLAMNTEKEQRGEPDYLASLGPPQEQAPSAPPNYVNGIILPLPPISDNPDYLKMTSTKSDSEESQFDFSSFHNSQPSPTLKNNLDTSPQQGSKRHKKKGIPEEIPMLRNHGKSSQGFNSDSETEATSPVPMVRTTKIQQPEHEYSNLKRMDRPQVSSGKDGTGKDAFSNPGYVMVNTVNEKRLN